MSDARFRGPSGPGSERPIPRHREASGAVSLALLIATRPLVQRECACGGSAGPEGECEECRGHQVEVQRAAGGAAGTTAPAVVHEVLRSPGRPLEPGTRSVFESRLGLDLSGVRLHGDARAAESARAVNARAYTVGRNIVFGHGRYQPHTTEGRRLLAHELTHVAQQGASTTVPGTLPIGSPDSVLERAADRAADSFGPADGHGGGAAGTPVLQRDLVTEEPTPAPAAQPDLTEAQIRAAIRFNTQRYNQANIRIIQDMLGGPVTGTLTEENILSIAEIQERYGLTKDGKVGADTFEFIQREQELEGVPTTDEECLTMFRAVVHPTQSAATAGPAGTTRIRGHHVVEARFSSRCNCSEFQYRQFIVGVATGTRAATGATQDLSTLFVNIPGGQLPAVFREDGMTHCASVNYGHRAQPGQARTTVQCGENQYRDAAGAADQANGCVYRGEDFPGVTVNGLQTGDVVDVLINFRGEIRRNGRTIQTRRWTTVDSTVPTP